jgi:LmbE family N-acetylglucosaminyl deacetylase
MSGAKFRASGSLVYVPDPTPIEVALHRTTHLGVMAHQDDLEIGAFHGILAGIREPESWFTGVTVTRGTGGPRAPEFAEVSESVLASMRREEQMLAADLGQYCAQVFLDYPSEVVKDLSQDGPTLDLADVLRATAPEVVYTHALSDRHPTHLAVTMRVIEASRTLPRELRPKRLLGCEIWGDLDWVPEPWRVALDVSGEDGLAADLIRVFKSQLGAGKRYDAATLGRRAAQATFGESHAGDPAEAVILAMDLSLLLGDAPRAADELLKEMLTTFQQQTLSRVPRRSFLT